MMQTRNRSHPRGSHPLSLDALEPRLLLSSTHSPFISLPHTALPTHALFSPDTPGQNFDLVPSITKLPKLATSIITGTAVKGSVTIHLANTGQDPSPAATLSVFLRPTSGADVNLTTTPVNIPSIKGAVTKNGITKDSTKDVTAKVTLPLNLAAGNYSLVVIVTDTSPIGSPAQTNNTLVDNAFTLAAAPGAFNVATTLTTSKIPATIATPSKIAGKLSLNFTNSGNIPTPAISEYNVSFFIKPLSGNNLLLLAVPNVKVPSIKANGGTQSIATNLNVASTVAVSPGSYTIIAILSPTGPTLGLPFTVNGPTINFTAPNSHPGVLLQHGNTISFNATTQIPVAFPIEDGTFVTNLSVTGNYQLVGGQLTLSYTGGGSDVIQVTYTGATTFFDPTLDNSPTTVIFSTDPSSAFASLLISGSNFSAFAKFA